MDPNLRQQLVELLERANSVERSSGRSSVLVFFNSPFFLTFLGGVLITTGSLVLENRISESKERAQRQREFDRRQQDFVSDFASGVSRSLSISYSMRQRVIWLKEHQHTQSPNLQYVDGRPFIETREVYEKQLAQYLELPAIDGLLPQATVLFPSLRTEISDFQKTHDEFFACSDQNQLRVLIKKLISLYRSLIAEMAKL